MACSRHDQGARDGSQETAPAPREHQRTLELAGVPVTLLPALHGAERLLASPGGEFLTAERDEFGHTDRSTGRFVQPRQLILVYDLARHQVREYDGKLAGSPGDDGRVCFEEDWRTGEVVFSDGQRLKLQDLEGRAYILWAAPGCSRFVANVVSRDMSSLQRELWAIDGAGRRLWKQPIEHWGIDQIAFSPSGDKLAYSISKSRAYQTEDGRTMHTPAGNAMLVVDFRTGKTLRSLPRSPGDLVSDILFTDEDHLLVLEHSGFLQADLRAGGQVSLFSDLDSHQIAFAPDGRGRVLIVHRVHTHGTSFSTPRLECGLSVLDLASGAQKPVAVTGLDSCPLRLVRAGGKVYLVTNR